MIEENLNCLSIPTTENIAKPFLKRRGKEFFNVR